MDVDGYACLVITGRSASNTEKWTKLKELDTDLKKYNGNTMTYTYSIDINDTDAMCCEFSAHGKKDDKYWLSNVRFSAKFE